MEEHILEAYLGGWRALYWAHFLHANSLKPQTFKMWQLSNKSKSFFNFIFSCSSWICGGMKNKTLRTVIKYKYEYEWYSYFSALQCILACLQLYTIYILLHEHLTSQFMDWTFSETSWVRMFSWCFYDRIYLGYLPETVCFLSASPWIPVPFPLLCTRQHGEQQGSCNLILLK